jgi:hypothetical protein
LSSDASEICGDVFDVLWLSKSNLSNLQKHFGTANLIANILAVYSRSRAMATTMSCAVASHSYLRLTQVKSLILTLPLPSAVCCQTLPIYRQCLAAFLARTAFSNTADISAMFDSSIDDISAVPQPIGQAVW